MSGLEIRNTVRGRGVFALRDYRQGEVVERCPVMVIPPAERSFSIYIRAVLFYVYGWNEPHWPDTGVAMCLGFGSLYNNSDDNSNLAYSPAAEVPRMMIFYAGRDIAAGEELTISYEWAGYMSEVGYGPVDLDGLPVKPTVPSVVVPADASVTALPVKEGVRT